MLAPSTDHQALGVVGLLSAGLWAIASQSTERGRGWCDKVGTKTHGGARLDIDVSAGAWEMLQKKKSVSFANSLAQYGLLMEEVLV